MSRKSIVSESIKLAVVAGGAFLASRAVAKSDTINSYMSDKFPGLASAGVSSGLFAGSIKMGKSIRDANLRAGVQAGLGANAILQIVNIAQIRSRLPMSVQSLLAGEPDPNVTLLTPVQLQSAIQAEAERFANKELAKMGFIQEDPKQLTSSSDSVIESDSELGDDDIYFGSDQDMYF